jgi:hypothetical protein
VGNLKRTLTRLKGRVVEPVSDAAGDRRSEAKARLEAKSGDVPDEHDVKRVERKVRRRHGDVSPPRTRRRWMTRSRG